MKLVENIRGYFNKENTIATENLYPIGMAETIMRKPLIRRALLGLISADEYLLNGKLYLQKMTGMNSEQFIKTRVDQQESLVSELDKTFKEAWPDKSTRFYGDRILLGSVDQEAANKNILIMVAHQKGYHNTPKSERANLSITEAEMELAVDRNPFMKFIRAIGNAGEAIYKTFSPNNAAIKETADKIVREHSFQNFEALTGIKVIRNET